MSNEDRLGERVQISELSDSPIQGSLPHPQDPWDSASSADAPFRDPLFEAQQARQARQAGPAPSAPAAPHAAAPAAPPAPRGQRPVPVIAPATRKETATLKRFREVFSLKRIDVVNAVLRRRDPQDLDKNVEMTFGLRGLGYEDYQWVLSKTQELLQKPDMATFAWKIAFMSMGVASIEGEPIWQVLGFEPANPEHVRDPMYPHMGLRFQAADAFCEELRTSLFDTVENLYGEYETKVDSQYLPKKEKGEKTNEGEAEGVTGPLP